MFINSILVLSRMHPSKNSLLLHWGHLPTIVTLSRSKSCPIFCVCLAKREFRSRAAMALECSRFLVLKARDVCPM